MKYLHIVPGADDVANGMARVARLLAKEQGDAEVVDLSAVSGQSLAVSEGSESLGFVENLEEVWVHGMWLPREWAICWRVIKAGKRLVRMTHGSLSPVYLKQQGRWKKRLVGTIERHWLRKADRIVATCDAEKGWIRAYLGKKCPEIVVEDVKRFFKLGVRSEEFGVSGGELAVSGQVIRPLRVLATHRAASKPSDREAELAVSGDGCNSELDTRNRELHVLYLGRRHPLKGVKFLESAVSELNSSTPPLRTPPLLKIVSNAFGEELEKVWEWCDVLVLPTLSENFGLVVAEALERGKRVITTDGAPVWGEESDGVMEWVSGGVECRYGGRLLYLKGYRDGSDEKRVALLKMAIEILGGAY